MDDPLLRRIERSAVAACLVMALAAAAVAGWWAALAVIGGGVLAAASYAGIASGITALTTAAEAASAGQVRQLVPEAADADSPPEQAPRRSRPLAWTLATVLFRYALLLLLAYVMIARLRLHPVGILAGASSVVAAAGVEAVRILVKKS